MRTVSSGELTRLKADAVATFNDACDIYAFTGTADSLGEISQAYDTGTFSVPCGFMETNEYRDERGQVVVLAADALLALPLTQALTINDKIVARSKTFYVDGITPGYTVKVVSLVVRDG